MDYTIGMVAATWHLNVVFQSHVLKSRNHFRNKNRIIGIKKRQRLYIYINLFIYLFLAALSICCCVRAFSSCGERGLLFVAVHRLLIAVASLVAEHGL